MIPQKNPYGFSSEYKLLVKFWDMGQAVFCQDSGFKKSHADCRPINLWLRKRQESMMNVTPGLLFFGGCHPQTSEINSFRNSLLLFTELGSENSGFT